MNQFYARTDLLLITHMLGVAQSGLYATNVKFVEVGVLPLVLLGVAAYPLLSRSAAYDMPVFVRMSRDLARSVFFLSGWLAVGVTYLLPILIVPLFGEDFAACIPLLHWFAVLALLKGGEITLYRLLYAVRLQNTYALSLLVGTVLIVVLNYVLIPKFGLTGAIWAGILSIASVVSICVAGLRRYVPMRIFASAAIRLIAALVITAAIVIFMRYVGFGEWVDGIVPCLIFPVAAIVTGLVPHPRHNTLFGHGKMEALEAVNGPVVTASSAGEQ
jgi:O-antigen/teichoic acid export membrane protein